MKNILVRSFVLVLVVAGFSASTISNAAVTKHAAKPGVLSSPTPMCRLNDKNGCGID